MFKPIRFAVLLAGVTLAVSAMAQPAPDDGPDSNQSSQGQTADPPTRVARLAFIRGDVSFVPAGENDWVEAQLNRPLITGDKLWTDRNSRTELEIGSSTIRMDQNTSFDFLNLDDKTAQVELTQGTLSLRVRRLYDNQTYEIDTPTLAFVINRVGEYRVSVEANGQATTVAVLHGGGDTYGEGNARFRVEEGQSVTFNDAQLQNYQSNSLPPPDDFDNFSHERDSRWDNAKSRQYVSEDVIGYQDLDDNGNWDDVAEYGHVWYPTTVAVDWSPYHSGHWGWVGAYGWSWVDDAPWGFAPFHYGRWAYIGNRWGWCPGQIDVRPVYAPALVAFVGGGVGVSIGFGSGPVGWFPLGYNDIYYPSYRVSRGYFGNVNSFGRGGNTTIINNYYGNYSRGNVNYGQINYANRNVAGAITAVPAAAFVSARPVASAAIAVNRETFANSRVSGFAAVAPTRASIAPATVARSMPPAAVANRQIVAATRPPAPVASFAQRQTLLQKNPGQPLAQNQLHGPVAVAGAGTAHGAVSGQPNLRVVTNTGAPVHSAAPLLPAHPGAASAASAHVAPTGGPAVTRGIPAVQSDRTAVQGAGVAHRPATSATGPAATTHLDSARFAHPGGANNAATGGNSGPQTIRSNTTTNQSIRNPSTSTNTNTNTGQMMGAHTAPVSHGTPTPAYTPSNNGNAGPKSNSVGNAHDSGYTAHSAVTPQGGKPVYHQASPASHSANAQEYHSPAATTTHTVPQTYQRPATIEHTPSPPPPPHVSTPPPPTRSAPVRQPPPPPKEKKDDDKKHGGR